MYRSTQRDDFVGVQFGVRMLVARREFEEIGHQLLHSWDARGTADQHDLANISSGEAGVPQCLTAWLSGALQDGLDQLLELRARDLATIKPAVWQRDLDARTVA